MNQEATKEYEAGSPFEVQDTSEFQRVLNLPRRDWEEAAKHNDLYQRMTRAFQMPGGKQVLHLIQASALADAHDCRGVLAPIRVGEGKTLVTFLLPLVVQGIKRPMLLIPAALMDKTWREFKVLQQHWVAHPSYMTRKAFEESVITYEMLGRDGGKDRIASRRPDMLIADECHKLRNRQAACTKRVERYMRANPETVFCGLSGTITKRSLRDYWHLLYWALKHKAPIPRTEAEMEKWADALDEKKVDAIGRRGPGVLFQLCTDAERQQVAQAARVAPLGRTQQMPFIQHYERLKVARSGYQKRLRDSVGVICSPDRNLDCSLQVRRLQVHPGDRAQQLLQQMRETWTTPNGDEIAMPMDIWRHARELACGFWYRWEPAPPTHWLQASKTWNWNVRQILSPDGIYFERYQLLHLDSPMQVGLAVTENRITEPLVAGAHQRWQQVRADYKINTVAEWVDETLLRYCFDWMSENKSGIVWTEHRAFGQRLAAKLGVGFCSNGGLDEQGRAIEDYNGKPVVASVQANHTGRNLQAWNRNLVVTAAPTGSLWEQMLGRTHRPGQESDTVYCDWISACDEQDQGFSQLLADARYIQDTTGQSQKLLYADHV